MPTATKKRPAKKSTAPRLRAQDKQRDSAFREGFQAHAQGVSDQEPPYPIGDPLRACWLEGWAKASKEKPAPKHTGNGKATDAEAKAPKSPKTTREKFEAQVRREIADVEKAVCQAALDERSTDEQHKRDKSVHKGLVKRLESLHAKLDDPQGHLPLEGTAKPLKGQKSLPLDGTPDEFGMVPLTQAKAQVAEGRASTKLPKGFIEKCSELDPPVKTVSDLERLIGEGGLQKVQRVGQTAVDKITDWVVAYRQQHPIPAPKEAPLPIPEPWQNAADELRALIADCEALAQNGPSESIEFASSVKEQAAGVLATVEIRHEITEAQATAITNWRDGVAKWKVPA